MAKIVTPINISSKEELYLRLDELLEIQKNDAIVGIRGLNLTEEEQLQLAKDLGDRSGWFPNNSEKFNHKYVENHNSNQLVENSNGDTVILNWHLERADYDDYIPIVAGVWNMRVFNCDPESGKTYFIDSRKIYQTIYTKDEMDFLKTCRGTWESGDEAPVKRTNYVNVVQNHWLTGEEQIRVEVHHPARVSLYSVKGEPPTDDEKTKFDALLTRFGKEVYENEELRIIHKWQQGDILIPDLFCLAHAVTGGFDPKDREFTGYWCYRSSPEKAGEDKIHPSWKGL